MRFVKNTSSGHRFRSVGGSTSTTGASFTGATSTHRSEETDLLVSGLEFLAMLVPHIALRFECRIYSDGALSATIRKALGWIHNDQEELVPPQIVGAEEEGEFVRLKRKSWARLIKKLYLDDPTLCPACRQPMKIISVITQPHQDDVIEKIR